jgi:hypothetical protein
VIGDALQVRDALGGRRLRGAQSFREKRASNIMPFSGQVLGGHERPFRPISPEWVLWQLADYVAARCHGRTGITRSPKRQHPASVAGCGVVSSLNLAVPQGAAIFARRIAQPPHVELGASACAPHFLIGVRTRTSSVGQLSRGRPAQAPGTVFWR